MYVTLLAGSGSLHNKVSYLSWLRIPRSQDSVDTELDTEVDTEVDTEEVIVYHPETWHHFL
mgnify:CR=1 FL=1